MVYKVLIVVQRNKSLWTEFVTSRRIFPSRHVSLANVHICASLGCAATDCYDKSTSVAAQMRWTPVADLDFSPPSLYELQISFDFQKLTRDLSVRLGSGDQVSLTLVTFACCDTDSRSTNARTASHQTHATNTHTAVYCVPCGGKLHQIIYLKL